jgi:hypothetical protein
MVAALGPGGNRPRAARYLGGETFAVGDTHYTFTKQGGAVAGLKVDQVYGLYVMKKQ